MRRLILLLGVLIAGLVPRAAAQPLVRPSARVSGGMLNPSDPFQVTMAFGAAAGIRVGRLGAYGEGLRQSHNGNAGADLTSQARTYWGVALEYEASPSGIHERQGLIQVGAGRLARDPFATSWYARAGVALRYRLAPLVAFTGGLEDRVAFLPYEAARCEMVAERTEWCADAVAKQAQHNFGFILALELTL